MAGRLGLCQLEKERDQSSPYVPVWLMGHIRIEESGNSVSYLLRLGDGT